MSKHLLKPKWAEYRNFEGTDTFNAFIQYSKQFTKSTFLKQKGLVKLEPLCEVRCTNDTMVKARYFSLHLYLLLNKHLLGPFSNASFCL